MPQERTFIADGKTYKINAHAWQRIRKLDIEISDIVRIIEARENMERKRHKTEYTGCYTPRWAQRQSVERNIAVKIVIDTRSTLALKTVHRMGNCPQEEQTS